MQAQESKARMEQRSNDQGSPARPATDRNFVVALARGLQILDAFASAEERLGNQELSNRCRLAKSTVVRLTSTLVGLGYLHQVADSGKYRLGVRTLGLAGRSLARLDVNEVSRPVMSKLAADTGVLVSLGIFDDMSMLYIANERGLLGFSKRLDVGSRIPVAPTAMGRAYLASLSEASREKVEGRIRALSRTTWPETHKAIRSALAAFPQDRCCVSFEEWWPGVNAIAVPMTLKPGLPPVMMNAAGPAAHFSREYFLREVRPRLLAACAEVEQELRQRP